jgi:hypothetical protein
MDTAIDRTRKRTNDVNKRLRKSIGGLTRTRSATAGGSELCFTLNYHLSTLNFLRTTARIMAGRDLIDKNTNQNGINPVTALCGIAIKTNSPTIEKNRWTVEPPITRI